MILMISIQYRHSKLVKTRDYSWPFTFQNKSNGPQEGSQDPTAFHTLFPASIVLSPTLFITAWSSLCTSCCLSSSLYAWVNRSSVIYNIIQLAILLY